MSLKQEPSAEPFHISAKWLFLTSSSDLDHSMQAYPKLGSLSAMANPLSKEPNSYKELVG